LETSPNPDTRLVLALVALHATSGTDLRNLDLSDVLLTRRQLLIRRPHGRPVVHLDDTTAALLHAWLRYRHQRWPRTVNSHLLVTQQTASTTDPVCADYVYRRFDPAGLTLRAVRADGILIRLRLLTAADAWVNGRWGSGSVVPTVRRSSVPKHRNGGEFLPLVRRGKVR
jgi:hypothetical protein